MSREGFPRCGARGQLFAGCAGFSLCWPLWLWGTALGRTCSIRCGARAWDLRSVWDLSRPRIKPVSPALARGFLPTILPGKSLQVCNSISDTEVLHFSESLPLPLFLDSTFCILFFYSFAYSKIIQILYISCLTTTHLEFILCILWGGSHNMFVKHGHTINSAALTEKVIHYITVSS